MIKRLAASALALALLLGLFAFYPGATTTAAPDEPAIVEISAGYNHTMIVKDDGSLWAAGYNSYGNLADGTTNESATFIKVMDGVKSAAAGYNFTMILKTDGSLWSVGSNYNSQLGNGTKEDQKLPVKIMDDVAAVSASNLSTMIIKTDGTLWACGNNTSGQLGNGTKDDQLAPVKVMDDVASVSTGGAHTLAVKTDGSLWAFGSNNNGQLGNGKTSGTVLSPEKIMDNVKTVSAGDDHSLIIMNDGSLYVCGYNRYGALGNGVLDQGNVPTPEKVMDEVVAVSAGYRYSMIVRADGTLWSCGDNTYGQLGDGTFEDKYTPVNIMSEVVTVAAGGRYYAYTLVLRKDGTVWSCGNNRNGQLGEGTTGDRISPIEVMSDVKEAHTCHSFSLVLKTDNTLWINAEEDSRHVMMQLDSDVATASAGNDHIAYIKADGSLWVAGDNYYGALGNGTTENADGAVKIMEDVAAVGAGEDYTLFLKNDGTLWGCGDGRYGVLGEANMTEDGTLTPVQILDGVSGFHIGNESKYDGLITAYKTDGTIWTWGGGYALEQLTDYIAADVGYSHTLLLQPEGTLVGTGYNSDGQLGDGTGESVYDGFVEVARDVKAFAAGGSSTYVLKKDGSFWVAGRNNEGQLGTGSYDNQMKLKKVMDKVASFSAGYSHTLVVKTDGTLWGFGSNNYGQLMDGMGPNIPTFVQVMGKSGAKLDDALLGEYIYGASVGAGIDGLREALQEIYGGTGMSAVLERLLGGLNEEQLDSSKARDDMALFAEIGMRYSLSKQIGSRFKLDEAGLTEITANWQGVASSIEELTEQYGFEITRELRSGIMLDSADNEKVSVEFDGGMDSAGVDRITVNAPFAAFTADAGVLDMSVITLQNLNYVEPVEEEAAEPSDEREESGAAKSPGILSAILKFWGAIALIAVIAVWLTVGRKKIPVWALAVAVAVILALNVLTIFVSAEEAPEVSDAPEVTSGETRETPEVRENRGVSVLVSLSESIRGTLSLPVDKSMGDSNYLVVVNEEGEQQFSKYNHLTSSMEARVSESGTYTVIESKVSFADVQNKSAEMRQAIEMLSSKGLMDGTTQTEFSPDDPINRAEFASTVLMTMDLYDITAENVFDDVTEEDWYFTAAASAYQAGLMMGVGGNTFEGETVIPKDQMVTIASRTLVSEMGYKIPASTEPILRRYDDIDELADWSLENIALATREELVHYRLDNRFAPMSAMTRGDAAIILYRLYLKVW